MKKEQKLADHAFRRLAHLMVGGENQSTIDNAHDFLVEQTLLEKGASKSIRDVREGVESLFLLRFSNEEIQNSISRLLKSGKIVENHNRYSLEVVQEGKLRKINSDTKAQEKKIYADWLSALGIKYPNLLDEEKEILLSDLKEYIHKVFLQHGAECSVFIYPDNNESRKVIENMSGGEIDRILTQRDVKIKEIRQIEFPAFLQNVDAEKRVFFAKLLDGTFIYNIIQVDKETLKILQEHLKSYVFYLDTNIIYALLDLHSPKKASTVEKSFNIARTFGVKFVASSRTIEEMNKSIELKGKELLSSWNIRRDLAQEGADLSEEENFTTAYLRSYSKTGITKEDFIEKFKHIPELLKAKGIEILTETEPISSDALKKEKESLMLSIPRKTHNIAEHDAYHILLIKRLREVSMLDQPRKEYWFLSFDSPLSIYAQKTRPQGERPFVYMPHQLLQIVRLFEQRTNDYDDTFVELFARPQIKFAQNVLPNNLTEKILSKISGFADLPKEIAMKIIVDQKFVSTISDIKNDEKQSEAINQKVELELTARVNELNTRVSELEKEKTTLSTEKEISKKNESESLVTKNRQLENMKTILIIVSSVLLFIVSYLVYDFWWIEISFIPRLILLSLILGTFLLILKLKWKFGVTFSAINTFLGVATVVFLIANYSLPVKSEGVTDLTSNNSVMGNATSSVKEEIKASTSTPKVILKSDS